MGSPTAKIAFARRPSFSRFSLLSLAKFFSPRRLISLLDKEIWENRERERGREMRKFSCPSGEGEIKKGVEVFNYYSIFLCFVVFSCLLIIHGIKF